MQFDLEEIPVRSLLSSSNQIQGKLELNSSFHLQGVVDGDLIQKSLETLHIGRHGKVTGKIQSAGPVRVEGRVEGNIVCETVVILMATGVVLGNISSPGIEVHPGAYIEGELTTQSKEKLTPVTKKAA